jgi:hypothetical protein
MSDEASRPGALNRQQTVELYFMEHRAKLLDLASFLDRVERAPGATQDPRMDVFRLAIGVLLDGQPDRTRRALELMSDPTSDPIAKAGGKGAIGVWPQGPNTKGTA